MLCQQCNRAINRRASQAEIRAESPLLIHQVIPLVSPLVSRATVHRDSRPLTQQLSPAVHPLASLLVILHVIRRQFRLGCPLRNQVLGQVQDQVLAPVVARAPNLRLNRLDSHQDSQHCNHRADRQCNLLVNHLVSLLQCLRQYHQRLQLSSPVLRPLASQVSSPALCQRGDRPVSHQATHHRSRPHRLAL